METKDFIIIGGAIALFYLYQKNKNKKSMTSTAEAKDEATPLPSTSTPVTPKPVTPKPVTITPVIPTPVIPTPVTPRPVTITPVNGGTTSGGQAIFTGNNVLTPNPDIIVGGTRPIPALIPAPIQTTEQALISGGVRPIVKPTRRLSTSIY
jgi:hypothetical protein